MNIHDWAIKHQLSHVALNELFTILGTIKENTPEAVNVSTPEAIVQNDVRVLASESGWLLWRNNRGALKDARGRMIRFGLGNDNKTMNKVLKTGDLVGPKPLLITQAHVGTTIGQFAMLECKPKGWKYSATEHEKAQLNAINLVNARGGYAKFTTGDL